MILDAALAVFSERGVHGVAVPELAARAGVGTGTIYRYFVSKEVLVNELFRREKRNLTDLLVAPYPRGSSPRDRFEGVWERLVEFARNQPYAFRFLELQDHRSYLDEESWELERALLAPLLKQIATLQSRGVFRKDVRKQIVMATTWGTFVQIFKAESAGHLRLTRKDIAAARDACWRMYQPD